MRISQLISKLEKTKEQYGDIHIIGYDIDNDFETYKITFHIDNRGNKYLNEAIGKEPNRLYVSFIDTNEEFSFFDKHGEDFTDRFK